MTKVQKVGESSEFSRELFSLKLARIEEFPEFLVLPSPHFALFLAWDARDLPAEVIHRFAVSSIQQGLVYCCVWGPDSKRVHDIFDHVIFERDPQATDYSNIPTTWHEYEKLDDALWFFLNNTFPADKYANTCLSSLAVVVGNDQWVAQINTGLADPMTLLKRTEQSNACNG
ncbi:MAG TPA: hypothetical protein VGQ81_09810 [Acidobacteriota bacterium]|nr:hypothetical protein [Acidobacteriota bacterium]